MNTRGELRSRLKTQLNMVDTSTLFTDDQLNEALNDAHIWAADRQPFPKTEKAKRTTSTSVLGVVDWYYDSPAEFKGDSIFKVLVNGVDFDPTEFEDLLKWKADNASPGTDRHFAVYGDQFFLHPAPTAAGIEIIVWGLIQPDDFIDDGSLTIFSNSDSALNEGVMRKALSDLLPKESKESLNELAKAQNIIDAGFARIVKRRYRFKRKDAPFFNPPDFFPQGNSNNPGNFTRRN